MGLSREMIIRDRYVNLPVKNGAPTRQMGFCVNGEAVREFGIELAEGEPDFWVFADVSAFQGERLSIEVDDLPPGSQALESITQSDAIVPLAKDLKDRFDSGVGTHYDWKTRQDGYMTLRDDEGNEAKADLMMLSIGAVTAKDGPFADIREITEAAASARRKGMVV